MPSSSPQPSLEGNQEAKARLILLASVFVVAASGLVYELVAGAVSSYLLGDPVTQFSIVLGVFLCAMGLGSYLAKFVSKRLLRTFIEVEVVIGLLGGLSSLAMFAVNAVLPQLFELFFYLICIALGILVGIEIPLLVRILDRGEGFRDALSHVLALDYVGALAGALLFPFVVLPFLGLSRASLVFGLMNLAVAAAGIGLLEGRRTGTLVRLGAAALLLVAALAYSTRMVGFFEDVIYQDSVIFARNSAHQRIVVTRWHDDVRLYLDGHIQFSSIDEARYHEALVIPAMEAAPRPRNVLVLGGGDGLAAREVLKYASVERVTLVDIDPVMTEAARTRPELRALNRGALDSPKLGIVNQDAMHYLMEDESFYEVVIIDLPDPHSHTLAKLYSTAFYALVARRLSLGGVMATQASSPFYAPEAFWCIVASIEQAVADDAPAGGLTPLPYHVHVPSFGDWGFVLASRRTVDPAGLEPSVETRYLDGPALAAMYSFGLDTQRLEVEPNRLDDPVLFSHYKTGWERFNE